MNSKNPKVFISYSWDSEDHKKWVKDFATKLRSDGIDISLDQWKVVPGDQLPSFMEKEIRENDFVLIICTPKYKLKSDNREGGAGYEGDIMTAEILNKGNQRKFIPILRSSDWNSSAPTWLSGKYYIDLSSNPIKEDSYKDILTTLYQQYPKAPPLGKSIASKFGLPDLLTKAPVENNRPKEIKIEGILVDEVSIPQNDGSRGSALYKVPFLLSAKPSNEWATIFIESWNHPPMYTSMHRPGIARVYGNKILLDGTTIEEVKQYHRDTLILAVSETNKKYKEFFEKKKREAERKQKEIQEHKKKIDDISRNIKF